MRSEPPPPPPLPDGTTALQRLAPLRDGLASEHLAPLLDAPCQTWYLQAVALALVHALRALYRRRALQVVQEQGREALPRLTQQIVTVATTATGALTVQVDLGTVIEVVPAPLARTLAQRYQAFSWQVLAQRLAIDLSAAALESLQQTVAPEALSAMSETVFAETILAAVLQATPTSLADRVRHRLEVQAQHDAVEMATRIEDRGPSLIELEYLLGLRHSTTRPARLLALLRQEHVTVFSAAHYQAIRTALAHNTFAEAEGIPWPTAVLATGPARGHAELRPLVADATSWMAPEIVEAWAQRMWQQRGELSDLDADVLDALSALWLRHARTPEEDAVADVDDLLAMRALQPKQRGHGRRSGYEPEQRQALLRALTHLQNLWLHMTELELYIPPTPGSRRRRRTTQGVQSRLFTITDLLGHTRPDGWFEMEKFIFRPGKVLAHFLHGPGRQTALLSACALSYDPYRQIWEKRLLRYVSWQWRTRAHDGNYGQAYRVDTLLEAIAVQVDPHRAVWQKARLEKAFDTIQADGGLAAWQYQELNLAEWWRSTVLLEPPEIIRATYRRLAPQAAPAPRALPAAPTLGARLQRRRLALGLSQIQAAEQLEISQAYLSLVERGTKTRLSATLQRKIRAWLGEADDPSRNTSTPDDGPAVLGEPQE
jgi:hypothetical protein